MQLFFSNTPMAVNLSDVMWNVREAQAHERYS